VENSLDACESVGVLPHICVTVEEMTQSQFNVHRGLHSPTKGGPKRRDEGLFTKKGGRKSSSGSGNNKSEEPSEAGSVADNNDTNPASSKKAAKNNKKRETDAYFLITVKDNGCGMGHNDIPNLLGRVLSGSKYGVRQTRGKFGLGAKMALIWSKKSTGVPITITTSHMMKPGQVGEHVSKCVLDIDIYKNSPRVLEHSKRTNTDGFVGTEFQVLIAGNWTTYKARIMQYLQQLAIITPYAQLELSYTNRSDAKKAMHIRYDRRSEQMPPPAKEVKHHPSSVNNLLVTQLLEQTKQNSIVEFLTKDLSGVTLALAKRLVAELRFEEDLHPSEITDKQITRLVQLLRSVELFKAPDGSCLSPLGEYNLNLGIRKVLEPDLVATAREKPSAYEGHPFIVEAAVSLGGKDVKEGITVVRFANRIPLLFEAGADVATRVAQSKIRWTSYKMDHKRDRIGVFVSIVSTKIPFKGTGKEYIGDDITEIQASVKRALQSCCQQLRAHLVKKHALRDIKERKSRLVKYVPDVTRSLFGILEGMRQRQLEQGTTAAPTVTSPTKRMRLDRTAANELIEKLENNEISETSIKRHLIEAIEAQGGEAEDGDPNLSPSKRRRKNGRDPQPLYLVQLPALNSSQHDIEHSLFTFRPIKPISRQVKVN
jgi:DNA topoisomerase VI B subunit